MDMVSVVVAAGEDPQLLCRTLDSLQGQNYPQVEVLVMRRGEDAPLPNHPWGKVVTLPRETTVGASLSAGAAQAKGEYLVFLQAGAELSPSWLWVAVRTLQLEPGLGWCYTGAAVEGGEDTLPPKAWERYRRQGYIFPDLITGWGISWQSVVLTREQYQRLGGFDPDLTALAGEELLLRLALDTPAKDTGTQMIQVLPTHRTSPQALVERCYWMSKLFPALERTGLVEQVMRTLLEDIDDAGAWDVTGEYLNILGENPQYQQAMDRFFQREIPQRDIRPAHTPEVSGVEGCVGCGGCQSICPVKAITMQPNEEGFLYPVVDGQMCIQCGACLAVCPTQKELPAVPAPHTYYAVQGPDRVRMKASSGGVFPLLAQIVLDQGGYVAGAVYDRDFVVRHVVSNKQADIDAMRTSKYAQSDTTQVYPVVKGLLEAGKLVLFTGTACQVAGLLAYLPREYDNLYIMDVVCHGVPSPGVFARYLDEFRSKGDPIAEVNFRKKEAFGWNPNLYIRYASGKNYAPKGLDLYMTCFLQNWILRESCYNCQFKGMRYSDLSVADFWGIHKLSPGFEDGKGTSFLTVNTPKGQELFRQLEGEFIQTTSLGREAEPVLEVANPNIRASVYRPAFRDIFFRVWRDNPRGTLEQVFRKVFASLHFDVGLVLFWGPNHGNALTNFALHEAVKGLGKSVLAIDNVVTSPTERFLDFARRHYVCSSEYFPNNAPRIIDECCDTLLVGSDQLWNTQFISEEIKYFQLSFAGDKTRKVAYASSFGSKDTMPPAEGYAPLYQRFDKIGVREKFGVEGCLQRYGVQAEHVMDPVFLLDAKVYENLASQSQRVETEPFIFSYIFFPNEKMMEFRRRLQRQLGGIKIISTTQANWETREDLRHAFDYEHVQEGVTVEDWLYYIKHARYIITDSFHATCFSMFFRKDFVAVPHAVSDRFTTLCQMGDAKSRISTQLTEEFFQTCMQPLDYDAIHRDLDRERERSRKWLENALG